ncbi:hypothetical protein [Sphingomonas sp.]|uniref:hypothetical protein n=1 Tax=Sphingomonas sp. TaxID=28214 RepID=UPI0035BC472C
MPDQTGFSPGVPHLAYLPFALHRVAFRAAVEAHLMNLSVFWFLQKAASATEATAGRSARTM